MNRELIYVSGPLSAWKNGVVGGEVDEEGEKNNMCIAIDVAAELYRRGHQPFVPHLSLVQHRRWLVSGIEAPWEYWIALDLKLLSAFDSLFYIAPSKGADAEKYGAMALGLKIYTDLEQVPYTSDVLKAFQEEYRAKGR